MKANETALGDCLVLLRRVATSKAIQSKMASMKWTKTLLNIAGHHKDSGNSLMYSFSQQGMWDEWGMGMNGD